MSFLSWGDIFTLPLGGDRIMELKQAGMGVPQSRTPGAKINGLLI